MKIEIQKTLSKSGKRTLWYPTFENKRITSTNFGKKWEAIKLGKLFIEIKEREVINNELK